MKSNKDYIQEDIIDKVEKLIKDTDIRNLLNLSDDIKNDKIITGANEFIGETSESPGSITLKMDPMKMNLFLNLKAPISSNNEIIIDDIKEKIKEFGPYCVSQVDWKYVREIYKRIIHDGEIISDVKIAYGKPVKYHIPEHIIIKESLSVNYKPEVLEGDKVNFHHIKSFLTVDKGEYLGDIISNVPGEKGMNLLGKEIPAPRKIINNYSPGSNTFISGDKVFSSIDGTFKIVRSKITVDPCLFIDTDIDYGTGDIEFEGDVHLEKTVRKDFAVTVSGDLLVNESLEPSDIICENNLYVGQGILGSEKYSIYCGGDVSALHLENVTLRAHGSVNIEKSITKSNVYSLDKLILGEKASIIGGVYHIQNGVLSGNIGNKMGVESHIVIGIDYEIEDKLKRIQTASMQIVEEINKIQNSLKFTKSRQEKEKIKELYLALKNRLSCLSNYARKLLSNLDKNDKSNVTVMGTVYPGTYIEICHVSFIVDKEYKRVKFVLDKDKGEITRKYI